MIKKPKTRLGQALERGSYRVSRWTGSSWGFAMAGLLIVAWLVSGPIFGFSDTWQLVINTGTTVVTFLMVFLIQRTQNKESMAVQMKLNEIVAALQGASNRLIDIEGLDEDDLQTLREHYRLMAEKAEHERSIRESHSIEEAEVRHLQKVKSKQSS